MRTLEDRGASRIEMPRVGVNDAEYWWSRASPHPCGRAHRLRGGEAARRSRTAGQRRPELPRRVHERQGRLRDRRVDDVRRDRRAWHDDLLPQLRTAEPERLEVLRQLRASALA